MTFKSKRKWISISVLSVFALTVTVLGSCKLPSTPVSIQGRIDKFNADLQSSNWNDLVNQFSDQTVLKSNGTMTGDPTTFFTGYPFGSNGTTGAITIDSSTISYNSTNTQATMTAAYTPEYGTAYTLTIVMVLNSSDSSWYVLSINFNASGVPTIQHVAPIPGHSVSSLGHYSQRIY